MMISKTLSGSSLRIIFKVALVKIFITLVSITTYQSSFAGGEFIPAPSESGRVLNEVRGGIFSHNVEDDDPSEDGADINVELLFNKPTWSHPNRLINHLITPRPHIGGHVNTSNSTNMLYLGLTWNYQLTKNLFFESSFGAAVHDGPLNEVGKLSYGCSLNFRESASFGWELSNQWNLLLTVDHMSNADLCDRNAGLTNVGARLGYKMQ